MVESLFAGLGLLVCTLLLLRLAMGARRRARADALVVRCGRRVAAAWRAVGPAAWTRRRAAGREADEAIHRARHGVQRDGNVLRPDRFRRHDDTLH